MDQKGMPIAQSDLAFALTDAPAQWPWPLVLLVLYTVNSVTLDTWAYLTFPVPPRERIMKMWHAMSQ